MDSELFLSVIVPVYNVERYLSQCLDSLIGYSGFRYEIILADDGSTDRSGTICDRYAKSNSNVSVIHQENRGLSGARNAGLRRATGKYVIFVDSDDFIVPDSLQRIVAQIERQRYPEVMFVHADKYYESGGVLPLEEDMDAERLLNRSSQEVLLYLSGRKKYPASACSKFVSRNLLLSHNLFFEEGKLSEDLDWSMRLLLRAQSFGCDNGPYYMYRQGRTGSITSTASAKRYYHVKEVVSEWIRVSAEYPEPEKKAILKFAAYQYKILLLLYGGCGSLLGSEETEWLRSRQWLLSCRNDRDSRLIRLSLKALGVHKTAGMLKRYLSLRENARNSKETGDMAPPEDSTTAALITLHRIYNYGSALQAYASEKVLSRFFDRVYTIDYISPQESFWTRFLRYPPSLSGRPVLRLFYYFFKFFSALLKEYGFSRFRKRNLHLTRPYRTTQSLRNDCPGADIYFTGSDQTWNSDYNEGVNPAFFLEFAPDGAAKASFAASFGKNRLDVWEKARTGQLLRRYDRLSVRETQGLEILHDLGLDGACLLDPTLQLPAEEWAKIAANRKIQENYLLLLLLYNEDCHATEYARVIADSKNLKLVKLSWEFRKPPAVDTLLTHCRPETFLSLFLYAQFVVTNSFHGTAFSVNFNKPFLVVPRLEYNSRITSLLDILGLSDRQAQSVGDALRISAAPIDYARVNGVLNSERRKAENFLEKCAETVKEKRNAGG